MTINNDYSHDKLTAILNHSLDEFIQIRQNIHQHPELAFKEIRTSQLIADFMRLYGYEVITGIGKTGLVASLTRGNSARSIAIRADMDALPLQEETNLPYASKTEGIMHACGHDGHITIALAAAKAIALEGAFNGTVRFIFQPAEEIGLGAKAMLGDDLFQRFPVDVIYGLHNWPNIPAGHLAIMNGPVMASVDFYKIKIIGQGSHGAEPQNGIDPITVAAYLITSLQTIVSRNINPQEMGVVTVGAIKGGNAANVIPDSVELKITVRAFNEKVRIVLKERLEVLAKTVSASFGATAEISTTAGFSAVINHDDEASFAREVALNLMSIDHVEKDFAPRTASEDFSFFLQAKKGAFIFIGNGDSAALHNPHYDFNDNIIVPAARYWAELIEAYLSINI